jgi:hypothetical protein
VFGAVTIPSMLVVIILVALPQWWQSDTVGMHVVRP